MNLVKAAAANDLLSTRLLLENGADAEGRYPWSSWSTPSPLFPASAGAIPVTPSDPWPRVLPQDVIEHVQYEASPLHVAVLGGHYEVVRLLVEAGADIMGKDGRGRTPITCAIYGLDTLNITAANLPYISQCHPSHVAIVRYLVRQPGLRRCLPRTQISETDMSSSPYGTAASPKGSHRRLGMLVEPASQRRPIDRPQEEINGITPLCLAAYLGKDVIVNALLKDGSASVDARDKNGATALMYAARDGHVQVVEALLFHGALPDATDDNGWTAIQYGQMYRHIVRSFEANLRVRRVAAIEPVLRSFEILTSYTERFGQLYVRPGTAMQRTADTPPSVNIDPSEFRVQLVSAIKRHDYPVIQNLLLTLRKQVNDYSEDAVPLLVNIHDPATGLTPMHYAVRAKPAPSSETLVALYQAGADVNVQTHYGRTPLHHLCHLKPGISGPPPAAGDEQGGPKPRATPRHLAQCAVLLLAFGALLSAPDRHGNTPLHFAAEVGGYLPVAKILVRAGADVNRRNAKGLRPCDVAKNPEMKNCLQQGSSLKVASSLPASKSLDNPSAKAGSSGTGMAKEIGGIRTGRGEVGNEGAGTRATASGIAPAGESQEDAAAAGSKTACAVGVRQKPDRIKSDIRRLAQTGNNTNSYIAAASANRTSNPIPSSLPQSFGHAAGTAYEAELNFDQVVENLEYFQGHYGTLVDGSMVEISRLADAVASSIEYNVGGASPRSSTSSTATDAHGVRQVLAACSRLRGELEQAYELVVVTNRQQQDVSAWYKAELRSVQVMRRELADRFAADRSRLSGLLKLCARIEHGLDKLDLERDEIEQLLVRGTSHCRAELTRRVLEAVSDPAKVGWNRHQTEGPSKMKDDAESVASSPRSSSTLVDPKPGALSVHHLYRKAGDLEEKLLLCCEDELEEGGEDELQVHDPGPLEPGGGAVEKKLTDGEERTVSEDEAGAKVASASEVLNGEIDGDNVANEGQDEAGVAEVAATSDDLNDEIGGDVVAGEGQAGSESEAGATATSTTHDQNAEVGSDRTPHDGQLDVANETDAEDASTAVDALGNEGAKKDALTANDQIGESVGDGVPRDGHDALETGPDTKVADDARPASPVVTTGEQSWECDSRPERFLPVNLEAASRELMEIEESVNAFCWSFLPEATHGPVSDVDGDGRKNLPGCTANAGCDMAQARVLMRRVRSLRRRLERSFSKAEQDAQDAPAANAALEHHRLSFPPVKTIALENATERSTESPDLLSTAVGHRLEEHNPDTLDLYCALVSANIEEAARDVADCESRLARVQQEKRRLCARLMEADVAHAEQVRSEEGMSAKAAEVETAALVNEDDGLEEVNLLMEHAEQLCAEHDALIAHRRKLQSEINDGAQQLEAFRTALSLKEPRELLRMLLAQVERSPVPHEIRVEAEQDANPCGTGLAAPAMSVLDARLRLQALDSALFAVRMLTPRQIRDMRREVAASREALSVAEMELTSGDVAVAQLEPRIAGARANGRHLLSRVNAFIQERKEYLERRWDVVYEIERAGREADGERPADETERASLASASSGPTPATSPFGQQAEVEEEFGDEEDLVMRQDEMRRKEESRMASLAVRIAQVAPTLEVLAASSASAGGVCRTGEVGIALGGDEEEETCDDVRGFRTAHAEALSRMADMRAALRGALAHRSRRGAAHLLEVERARLLGRPGVSGLVPEVKAVRRYFLDLRERYLAEVDGPVVEKRTDD